MSLCWQDWPSLSAYISWGKWPDPLIDFGRELYLPWRTTQGAVLFKDEMLICMGHCRRI